MIGIMGFQVDIYEQFISSISIIDYFTYLNFQTKAEKEENLDKIKNGTLDIIVGTHSLLGDRVTYNNLGLLVVDEEQVYQLSAVHIFLWFNYTGTPSSLLTEQQFIACRGLVSNRRRRLLPLKLPWMYLLYLQLQYHELFIQH